MKTFVCCIILALVNLFSAFQYLCYYADYIGERAGEITALFIVPPLFGLFTGALGIRIMCSGFRMSFYKKYWWILLFSAFLALFPSLYFIVGMSLFGDRGG